MPEQEIKIAKLEANMEQLRQDTQEIRQDIRDIKELLQNLDRKYVSKIEFEPIRKVVYGLISLILTSVIIAVIGLVLIK